jgi:hypothetical protein
LEDEDQTLLEDDQNLHGTQELHGIQIKTETDNRNLAGGEDNSPSKINRNKKAGNIEETKINFFDPSVYEHNAPYLKPEEDQIIEAKVDAVEWRAEVERVYEELLEVEKDIELAKN